jgi:arabinose-5-phosphate isomerase
VGADLLAADLMARMNARRITSVFVVDGEGRPLGFLHLHDLLQAGLA